MRTPEFTAEASFQSATAADRTPRTSPALANRGKVLPQLSHWSYCDNSGCYICTPAVVHAQGASIARKRQARGLTMKIVAPISRQEISNEQKGNVNEYLAGLHRGDVAPKLTRALPTFDNR